VTTHRPLRRKGELLGLAGGKGETGVLRVCHGNRETKKGKESTKKLHLLYSMSAC